MNDNGKKSSALFTPSGCLTGDALTLFVSESLKGAELTTVEQHIADCTLCADAAEGLRMWLRENNTGESLKKFHTRTGQINDRLKKRLHTRAILEATQNKRLSYKPSVWLAAAASILLFIGVGYVFWIQNQQNESLQAQKQLKDREAALIAQIPENLAYPPSNSKVILDIKYNSEKGTHLPPVLTIVNQDVAMASEREVPHGKNTGNINDGAEYTESKQGVESDVFKEEYGTYKGQNAKRPLSVKNSGGAMQKTETDEESSSVFMNVQQMPSFPGGDAARLKFLAKNLRYPFQAVENGIEGTVFVSFVVKTDGRITNVRLLHRIGGGCDEEAIRVVSKMPQWKPGYQNGKKVDVLYNMPVSFKIQ